MSKISALAYCLYLIKDRSKTKFQLQEKLLQKEYPLKDTLEAIKQLEEMGLVNDQRYAEAYSHDKLLYARRGHFRIALELRQKGVSKEIVDKVTREITEDQEIEAAKQLLAGRERSWQILDDRKRYQRSVSLLQRRGFSGSVIKKVLTNFY